MSTTKKKTSKTKKNAKAEPLEVELTGPEALYGRQIRASLDDTFGRAEAAEKARAQAMDEARVALAHLKEFAASVLEVRGEKLPEGKLPRIVGKKDEGIKLVWSAEKAKQ